MQTINRPDTSLPSWFAFDPAERYRKASALVAEGDLTAAIHVLETLTAFYPDHADAHNDLGVLYFRKGNFQCADQSFQAALAIDPDNPVVRQNRDALREKMSQKMSDNHFSGPAAPSRPAWQDYPKFSRDTVTILLVSTKDLLLPEIRNAAARLGHRCEILRIRESAMDAATVKRMFTQAIQTVRPDFVLTVNHLGLDREGLIIGLLEQCRLPFASWCVDSPHLILHHYANTRSPWLTLFMWDADYIPVVTQAGFERSAYLPLGVDDTLFTPAKNGQSPLRLPPAFVSFVGNSMAIKTASVLNRHRINGALLKNVDILARVFEETPHINVRDLMAEQFPSLFSEFQALSLEQAYGYEAGIIWQATGNYRQKMVRRLKPFDPVIIGDPGWRDIFGQGIAVHQELNYYEELPWFYNISDVSFNATSRQMKNGVNQRVFDVPACRRVLLTDHTRQLEALMEPGKEVLTYTHGDEIGYWLDKVQNDSVFYNHVAENGYRRVIAEHTYPRRLTKLVETMRRHFREGV